MFALLHRFADWLILLFGWRRALVALAAGALSTLSLPPFFFIPILFLTLPVLVLLLDGADADPQEGRRFRRLVGRAGFFSTGFWFGFGWFAAGLYWIAEALLVDSAAHAWLIPFAVTLIPAGLALFFGIATAIAGSLWVGGSWRLLALAATLVALEWLRGVAFTGFPWNSLHMALAAHPALLQGFAFVGPLGASFAVVAVALVPAALWPGLGGGPDGRRYAMVAFAVAIVWVGGGALRLAGEVDETIQSATVRIVQPNIAQADKWDPELRDQHFASLLDLTTRRTDGTDLGLLDVTHVFWPESAFPFLLTDRPDALTAIGSVLPLGTTLIAGALRAERRDERRVFTNAIFALNDSGEITDAYDKVRLVPFGEQLPFGRLVDRLGLRPLVGAPSGFIPGASSGTLETPGGPSGLGLVCYEAIFSDYVREGVLTHQPDFLINVTNDAWFGRSIGPVQHFHQARIRSVETGRPLVRAANTGISAIVDARGRVVEALAIDNRGVLTANLPNSLTQTAYLRWGHLPIMLLLMFILSVSVYHRRSYPS